MLKLILTTSHAMASQLSFIGKTNGDFAFMYLSLGQH